MFKINSFPKISSYRAANAICPTTSFSVLCFPQVDTYGTQQPIALLKLLLERGGMYDRGKDLNWKNMRDMGYIASMGKAGGGRNETDPRFVSLFSVFNMTFPDAESLFKIYNSILQGHLQPFPKELQDLSSTITNMTMDLYRWVHSGRES